MLKSKKILIALILVIILILAGVCYFVFYNKNKVTSTAAPTPTLKPTVTQSAQITKAESDKAKKSATDIVNKIITINVSELSSAMSEINSTITTFSSAGQNRR